MYPGLHDSSATTEATFMRKIMHTNDQLCWYMVLLLMTCIHAHSFLYLNKVNNNVSLTNFNKCRNHTVFGRVFDLFLNKLMTV